MTDWRITLVPPVAPRGEVGTSPASAVAQHDGAVILHVHCDTEQLPTLAAVVWALDESGGFDQRVLDVDPVPGAERLLADLEVRAPLRRVDPRPETLIARIERELAEAPVIAVVLYAGEDGTAAASAALAAARLGISLVRVGPLRRRDEPSAGQVVRRLSDLLLVDDAHAGSAAAEAHRVHAVGNPRVDAAGRLSRKAIARERWAEYGVGRRRYVLAVLTQASSAERLAGHLRSDAGLPPLLVEATGAVAGAFSASAGVRLIGPQGFVDRLSLAHGAGLILTDSPGVQADAAAIGAPCHAVGASGPSLTLSADMLRRESDPAPRPISPRDARANQRVAQILVANFGRVRLS